MQLNRKSACSHIGCQIAVKLCWYDIRQLPRLGLTLMLHPTCVGSRSWLDGFRSLWLKPLAQGCLGSNVSLHFTLPLWVSSSPLVTAYSFEVFVT